MDRKFGLCVFLGLVLGGIFGFGMGAANGNALVGSGSGALAGVFIGWFIAAAMREQASSETRNQAVSPNGKSSRERP
jgi:uncharacterized protein YcfJ